MTRCAPKKAGRVNSILRLSELLTGALRPEAVTGQTTLEAALLVGQTRTLVETSLKTTWADQQIELSWDGSSANLTYRAYLINDQGSRSMGTAHFGSGGAGPEATPWCVVGTGYGQARLELDPEVIAAVLA